MYWQGETYTFCSPFRPKVLASGGNPKLPHFTHQPAIEPPKDLYRQAKHKDSKLVHTDKCQFYTEGIALASSSKELHQIVNTLTNRHPPKILPTIYPRADLPSLFNKHFTNKVKKLRANIASENVRSALVTGTTTATFSLFESVTINSETMHS